METIRAAGQDVTYSCSRPGSHRYYLKVAVPCPHGTIKTTIPLYHEDHDPTAQFQALYSRRNDSESFHRQIKRNLPRLPAYKSQRQQLFIIAMSLLNNAATHAFDLQRQGHPNPLDGTT